MGFLTDLEYSRKSVQGALQALSGVFPGWGLNPEKKGVDLVHPLFVGGCEVKRDRRAAETGNVFFETSCSGKPSGLYRYEDCVFWFQWDDLGGLLFDRRTLLNQAEPLAFRKLEGVGDGNASGFLIKRKELEKFALLTFPPYNQDGL